MNINEMSLFIIEIFKINDDNRNILYYGFENLVNEFIYKMHKENPKLINSIIDIQLLDELEGTNTQLVSIEIIITIINEYKNIEDYLQLIDQIDIDTANQINDLAILFLNFKEELYQEWLSLMSSPHVKILQ